MKKTSQIIAVLFVFCVSSCNQKSNEYHFLSSQSDFSCPTPGVEKFEPWGEAGSARACEIRNGSYFVAERGKLVLTGQYLNGKQVGVWKWYDKEGKVIRKIDYSTQ